MNSSEPAETRSLLVTDFDGTMTRVDFYMLAARSLLPPDMPDYWAQYRAGQLTHFEALRAIFASIRANLATVRESSTGWNWIPIFPGRSPSSGVQAGMWW